MESIIGLKRQGQQEVSHKPTKSSKRKAHRINASKYWRRFSLKSSISRQLFASKLHQSLRCLDARDLSKRVRREASNFYIFFYQIEENQATDMRASCEVLKSKSNKSVVFSIKNEEVYIIRFGNKPSIHESTQAKFVIIFASIEEDWVVRFQNKP